MADPDDDSDPPPDDPPGDREGDADRGDRSPDEFEPGPRSDEDPGGDRSTDHPDDGDEGGIPEEDRREEAAGSGDGGHDRHGEDAPDEPGDDAGTDGPDGDRVEVTVDEDATDDESFGGGADPGEDPHDAGPGAGPDEYGPDPEDRRAERDRSWVDEDSVRSELDRLWEDLEGLEDHVQDRTVSRESFEAEMKRYVRWRLRKGHVTGWGPYVVLLYGTGMTLGAFYYLESVWAILAMLVVWLSTLGLYVLMVILGIGIGGARFAWKYLDKARSLRSEG